MSSVNFGCPKKGPDSEKKKPRDSENKTPQAPASAPAAVETVAVKECLCPCCRLGVSRQFGEEDDYKKEEDDYKKEIMDLWKPNTKGGFSPKEDRMKIVVLGNGAIGKTCLLIRATTGDFPGEYIPTVFDNYSGNYYPPDDGDLYLQRPPVNIGFWDMYDKEDYDRLRPLSYPGVDVFLVCCSLISQSSLWNVKAKWVPEIEHHCGKKVLRVLVGTKSDLRECELVKQQLAARGQKVVTTEQLRAAGEELGASAVVECSSLTGKGVAEVVRTAVDVYLEKRIDYSALYMRSKAVQHILEDHEFPKYLIELVLEMAWQDKRRNVQEMAMCNRGCTIL